MSVDKFLSDAVSAARDHADDGVTDGAHTRMRLRESLANRGVARRKRFTLIAALIASLFGSTAFAYWAGWRPPWTKAEVSATVSDEESPEHVSMRLAEQERGRPRLAIPDAGELAVPDAGIVETPPPPPAIVETPVARVETPAPVPVVVAPKPTPKPARVTRPAPRVAQAPVVESTPPEAEAPPPAQVTTQAPVAEVAPDTELSAYREAHNLHFRGASPAAALAAWDAYLKAYPNGTLAIDARYSRALVLVKLARWADARAALAPFANAKAGTYRQREAAEILAAIKTR